MRPAMLAAAALLAGCSREAAPPPASKTTAPVRITQFYASPAEVERGGKTLICYGVENAKAVWIAPPRRELSAALSRCVDIEPGATTTYTLTAEGEGGPVRQDVTVTIGAARPPGVKIIEVRVTSLSIKRGEAAGICYKVSNAAKVLIDPPATPSERDPNCGVVHPDRTTTYTVTATGHAGDRDQERVTIQVR